MICLYLDSFTVGTRWTAFQAGKAILSFVLYSKSAGEIMGALGKIEGGGTKVGAVCIFMGLWGGPAIVINMIFGAFFVLEQEVADSF